VGNRCWWSKLLFVVLAVAFAWFVWPTPWHYTTHQGLAARIHRASGYLQVYTGDGWRGVTGERVDGRSLEEIRADRVAQQMGRVRRQQVMAERQAAQWSARAARAEGENGSTAQRAELVRDQRRW